jgi:hypothetical protein
MQMFEPAIVCRHVLSRPSALSGRTKVLSELCVREENQEFPKREPKGTTTSKHVSAMLATEGDVNASALQAYTHPAVFSALRSRNIVLFGFYYYEGS